MLFTLIILGVLLYAADQPAYLPTFFGAIQVLIFLIILKKTRRYRGMAITFSVSGTLLCQFTLLYYTGEYHMVDVLWMMVIVLYTFFMLGKVWGTIVLAVNTIGVACFVVFVLNLNLSLLGELSSGQLLGLVVNFIVCHLLIAFLILQFLRVIRKAENDFRRVNIELKEQNETVALQNEEKTVMLKEIHHRVKNNLQVITSLLRLQSEEFKDPESKQNFNDTIHRVRSMAHIHERMYQSEHLSKIDVEGYIRNLSSELIESYEIKKTIELTVYCEMQQVHPKSLVSLALIFNELVSNSLKHGFETIENPNIKIDLRLGDHDKILLNYSDNGLWKISSKKSFGMELIESLTDQLNGSMSIDIDSGTQFQFIFDKKSLLEEN
ncbi:MAG: hypothetical protein Crog4KO_11730 [Crocinitomicaceae bacterium]